MPKGGKGKPSDNGTITGNKGKNTLRAGPEDTIIYGLAGDDRLFGDIGNDQLFGGDDNDLLDGGAGNDLLDGGAGNDIAVFSAVRAEYSVLVRANGDTELTGPDGIDVLRDIETVSFADGSYTLAQLHADAVYEVLGTDSDDTITTGAEDHLIDAGDGNDTIDAGGGDDTILAGAGNDSIAGGDGTDTVVMAGILSAYSGTVNNGVLSLTGEGTDTFDGVEFFRFADQTLSLAELVEAITVYTYGTSSSERLEGSAAVDVIFGYGGNDTLVGYEGDDTLYGGDGSDTLSGREGADSLYGEAGNDWFYADFDDVVVDGGAGYDRLFLNYSTAQGFNFQMVGIEYIAGSAGDNIIDLRGYTTDFDVRSGTAHNLVYSGGGNDNFLGAIGTDTFVLSGNLADYQLDVDDFGIVTITDLRPGGDGIDTLDRVETVRFADGEYALADLFSSGPGPGTPLSDTIVGTSSTASAAMIRFKAVLAMTC